MKIKMKIMRKEKEITELSGKKEIELRQKLQTIERGRKVSS